MTRRLRVDVAELLMQLSERDRTILDALRAHRLLTTAMLRRLHFPHGPNGAHATEGAASAAAMRVLTRLEERGLVARLTRRIGGVRAGSSGIVWQLGASGERLLRTVYGDPARRRYVEPSAAFIAHTLDTAELAVRMTELARHDDVDLVTLETEPQAWRAFVGAHGTRSWLKPDLFAVVATGEYEDHWFIEVDRATEHPGVVVKKAQVYQRYAATGPHQTEHGLFPAVLWVVPDAARERALLTALAADRHLDQALFRVVTRQRFSEVITGQDAAPTESAPPADRKNTAINEMKKGGTQHGNQTTEP